MNLYLITAKKWRYDDFTSITVRASSEDEARRTAVEYVEATAKEYSTTHFARVWGDPNESTVHQIALKDGPQVVASQFRHG